MNTTVLKHLHDAYGLSTPRPFSFVLSLFFAPLELYQDTVRDIMDAVGFSGDTYYPVVAVALGAVILVVLFYAFDFAAKKLPKYLPDIMGAFLPGDPVVIKEDTSTGPRPSPQSVEHSSQAGRQPEENTDPQFD